MKRLLFILALFFINSLTYAQLPNVLVCGAEGGSTGYISDVRTKLIATGLLGTVDTFNVNSGTPTLAQLQAYNAVLLYRNSGYSNPITLGNNLAAYIDGGGGVVTA